MTINLNIKNKKLFKNLLVSLIPLLAVSLTYVTYKLTKDDNATTIDNKLKETSRLEIYLLDHNNILTPLNVEVEKKEDINERIKETIDLLKEDSPYAKKGFKGLLSNNTSIKDIEIIDDKAVVNFKHLEYDESKESRVIESLTYTLLRNFELACVELEINDQKINKMPVNNTYMPTILDLNIGINKHLMVGRTIDTPVNVYYLNKVNEVDYFTPVTVRVEDSNDYYQNIIKGMKLDLSSSFPLDTYSQVGRIELSNYLKEEDFVEFEMTNKFLVDETSIDENLFSYFVMNILINDEDVNYVSFKIDDMVYKVSGNSEDVIDVSSVIYNEFKG